ncbi:MAG: hypothetical protein OIF50_05490 [Flavobacteriaceae bacterium]|nr:hypothetical protein [Flavobacteriaceae bacterium]
MRSFLQLCALLIVCTAFAQRLDTSLLGDMRFRSIGPAGMSGRITTVDVVESDNSIIYAGSSAGSLWKSANGGVSFQPIFENQKTASIGDIKIFQSNPNILYMGTGEGNPRNSQSYGFGMYKSIDAGKTWQHLGLEETKNIHRVIVHPNNPDIVWVGAIGSAWGSSHHRGVYKTIDGGKSWKKILYVNDKTGVADMVLDPSNPNKILVAMWEYYRKPWFMESGGVGSAIYMTIDGGDNWRKLDASNGLPNETLGRIGIAFAKSNPNVIYANIETKAENAMYRSNDGGNRFVKTTNKGVGDRPFYYADVRVDPTNENRVFHIATTVSKSEDGGKSFKPIMSPLGGVHSDHHAFWINPSNPKHIIDGNDGGLYTSNDGGNSWRFHQNIAVGQFYHINVDNEVPYNVYGGMQDNGSWKGPAYKFMVIGSLRNKDFKSIGFGDGFDVIPDPKDSRYGYAMSQGGEFIRYDSKTGIQQNIKPRHPKGEKLRFNWDAGFNIDPFDNQTIYGGSQYVHKSKDQGKSWTIISPDLTTNDRQKQKQPQSGGLTIDDSTAENHCSILVIEPSSQEKDLIWVGTDDGNIQITRDGGANWKNVSPQMKGLPANSWVAQIKHSKHVKGAAFAVIEDHRRDNWEAFVLYTTNYGKSWKRLVDSSDVWGFALSFVQDPIQPNLMFVGTEFGLYFSIDAGAKWQKWKNDFPTVAVKDMVIHPREHDLVVGTFGRSIYVLDDIRPLRELASSSEIMSKKQHLFEPPATFMGVTGFPPMFDGANESFAGKNRPYGAPLSFYTNEKSKKNGAIIEISNSKQEVVRTIKLTAKKGINRTIWDLKTKGSILPGKPDLFSMFLMGGSNVNYGSYTIKLKIGEEESTTTLEVLKDPNSPITHAEYQTNITRKKKFNKVADSLLSMYKKVKGMQKSVKPIEGFVAKDENLKKELQTLSKQLGDLEYRIVPKSTKGLFSETPDMRSQVLSLAMYYFNPMVAVDNNSEMGMEVLHKKMELLKADINKTAAALQKLKDQVNTSGVLKWQ